MENKIGRNEELIDKHNSEVVEAEIEKDDESMIAYAQKDIFKKLLELNILYKNLNINFATDKKLEDVCRTSIANSEKALKLIDTIENNEIILYLYNELQANFGQYIATILGYVSGSLSDDRYYQDDKNLTKIKNGEEI